MNVKELIEKLKSFPLETEVIIASCYYGGEFMDENCDTRSKIDIVDLQKYGDKEYLEIFGWTDI